MSQEISFKDYDPPARFDSIPWTAARIYEALTATADGALIDTITFDEPDPDPANPQARSFSTTEASETPALWYYVVFIDDDENVSQPTARVQNATPEGLFATAGDLATRLGIDLTDEEETRAELLIASASGLIRNEVKQTITLVEDDVLTMPGTTDERITLPQRPVVEIASVTLGDAPLVEGADWYLDRNTIVRLPRTVARIAGLVDDTWPGGIGFGTPTRTLEITYTHGYEDIPLIVKSICLEAVVRVWVNPGAVIQERVGDTMTEYAPRTADARGLLLLDDEHEQLRRFFGTRAISITIGG